MIAKGSRIGYGKINVVGEPILFEVGPVIGVHTGPGTVGINVRALKY